MESGKSFGTEDVSRSCESGWTMYLASHSHDPDDDCYYEDGDDEDSDGGESMDSDASSGPMEATSTLKLPQDTEEQNSIKKKKKANEEMVLVETRVHNNNHDDDAYDNDDVYNHDDGNDSYSAVHSYVGAVRQGQAAREKTQWEAKTLGERETKLEDNLDSLQGDISSFTRDDVDETELRRLEDARLAYVAAVSNAKERQDEESLAMAAKARAYLQSLAFRY
ncbi:unnamed protein product [Brassica rapa]|uniref:Uncharacterized protein n=1 Tax=Brassica campestris TaxID=3711 RepID=A0A3P6AHW3_BRACM|nr:unnamed protein product [Brassica rapa]VDC84780.1 unnamed protein product [Brassica rapa]